MMKDLVHEALSQEAYRDRTRSESTHLSSSQVDKHDVINTGPAHVTCNLGVRAPSPTHNIAVNN